MKNDYRISISVNKEIIYFTYLASESRINKEEWKFVNIETNQVLLVNPSNIEYSLTEPLNDKA